MSDICNRVMYFTELASSIHFSKEHVEILLNSPIVINELSDAIELYNIKKIMDTGGFSSTWEADRLKAYKFIVKNFPSIIISYITQIPCTSEDLEGLDKRYRDNFWELVTTFDIYKNWDDQHFSKLSSTTYILTLLKNKKIVERFNKSLTARLLSEYEIAAELIIDFYFIANYSISNIFFPDAFTSEEMIFVIGKYISDSANPNLNYLRAVLLNQNANQAAPILSPKMRLAAEQRCKALESDYMKSGSLIISRSIGVQFNPDQTDKIEVISDYDHFSTMFSYSTKWILRHLDYNMLLCNFKNLFGFIDSQFRIALINSESQKTISERYLFANYRNSYAPSSHFEFILNLEKMQMLQYYKFLEKIEIRLEDLLKNYYEEGLEKLFAAKGFRIEFPSEKTNYFEKCKCIIPEIDRLLKQFKIFVEEGVVDHELLRMESNVIGIDAVGSLIPQKYFIAANDKKKIGQALYSLFSDQCMLHYVQRIEKSYKCFYALINQETITKADYEEIPVILPFLDWLIDNSFVKVEIDGKLCATDRARILYDLYQHETICYYYNSTQDKAIIKELEAEGFLECEETLFAKSERNMFNYLLNRQNFSDSLNIRNDYIHGSQQGGSQDDNLHMENYMLFLIIIVDITLKVTEECHLKM